MFFLFATMVGMAVKSDMEKERLGSAIETAVKDLENWLFSIVIKQFFLFKPIYLFYLFIYFYFF
jgi:hypothetical protein